MIGQTLGPYRITAEVARGGQATLYKAKHTVLGRETALKVLHPHLITVADFVQKFEAESRILARLKHPNIVAVYDAGVDQGLYWIAMEWLDGQAVDDLIARQGKLSVDQAVRIADQVAAALEYAHAQGLIHRDIKPANMMLLPDGTAKVLDFGIAAIIAAGQKAATRIGTVEYMSYEQFNGQADHRSDLYSLGASLYHMLTGQLPPPLAAHPPTPPRQLNSRVPSELETALYQALRHEPADRYQTAQEFRRALNSAIAIITDTTKTSVRQCSRCGTDNRVGAKFCKDCGQSLDTVISGAQPLIIRQMRLIPRSDGFEPRFTWLPGRNVLALTDICALPHDQNCVFRLAIVECPSCGTEDNTSDQVFCVRCGTRLSILPSVEELDHFRKRCKGCGAFVRSVGLFRLDVGSDDKELLAVCLTGNTRLDAAEDGRRLAFTSANDLKIWELDVDRNQLQRLTDGDGEHLCPQYLENGVLAYLHVTQRVHDGGPILLSEIRFHDLSADKLLNSVSTTLPVFTSDITGKHFAILSAGRKVALLSVNDQFHSIREISYAGQLPKGKVPITRLVVSPDGKTLIVGYLKGKLALHEDAVGDLGPGRDQVTINLTTNKMSKVLSAAAVWDPDGQFVADPRSGVFEDTGKDFTPLVLFGPQPGRALHWSPDRRKLLADRYGQIWVLNPDGMELQYLTEGYTPQWSPDGRYIAFLRSPQDKAYELWVMRVEPA